MNKFKVVLFSLFFSLFFSLSGISQVTLSEMNDLSNVKIDSYSDDQISELLQNAKGTDLYSLLSQKGLPDNELQKLKKNKITKIA